MIMATPNLFETHVARPPAPGRISLRSYQQAAVDATFEAFEHAQSALTVMPTGCGKTIYFSSVAAQVEGRVMVLAHREELIHQASKKLRMVTGETPDIEMASWWADEGSPRNYVVSSIQTQVAGRQQPRMQRFDPADFGLVVVDEAHHAASDSYRRVIDHYAKGGARILGVTATPDRADEAALGEIFESVAYDYEINDAVRDGWLVPITQRSVIVEDLDFSKVGTVAGDFNQSQLAKLLEHEHELHEIAAPTIELTQGKQTLVFTVSVRQAEMLCEILNRYEPGQARWVCGKTPKEERRDVLRSYAERQFRMLVNVGVFTEGFDEPGIEAVVIARPTKSRSLYSQMVGRGTRVLPNIIEGEGPQFWRLDTDTERRAAIAASPKPNLMVLDFVGNAGQHKLICPSDILGGKYADDVVERAKVIAQSESEGGKPVDVAEQLAKAEQQIHDEKKKAQEAEQRRNLKGKAKYSTASVDPFDVLDIEPPRERAWDRGRVPSERMVEAIKKFTKGEVDASEMTFAEAKGLLDKLINRAEHDWCSYKQAKILRRYGYDPKGIRFDEASQIIDQIAANGWKRPAPTTNTVPDFDDVGFD